MLGCSPVGKLADCSFNAPSAILAPTTRQVPSSGPIVTAVREDSAQSIENWTYEESSYSDEGEGEEVVINEVDMDDAGSSSS